MDNTKPLEDIGEVKMKWVTLKDKDPPLDKLVLVWRHTKKKYEVLRFSREVSEKRIDKFWLTQGNSVQDLDEEDQWHEFKYFTMEERTVYE